MEPKVRLPSSSLSLTHLMSGFAFSFLSEDVIKVVGNIVQPIEELSLIHGLGHTGFSIRLFEGFR